MSEYDYILPTSNSDDRKKVTCWLAAVLGFLATSILINAQVTQKYWHPEIPMLTDRIERYRNKIDEIEVIVIGSSHVFYGFHEAEFNKATSQYGAKLISFNFGIEALSMAERREIVELICDETPPNLKCVLVEPEVRMITRWSNLLTRRARYYLTYSNVFELAMTKWSSNRPLKKRLVATLVPVAGSFANMVNLGVAPDITLPAPTDLESSSRPKDVESSEIDHQWIGPKRFDGSKSQVLEALKALNEPSALKSRDLTKSEFATIQKDIESLKSLDVPVGLLFPPTTLGFEEDSAIRSFAQSEKYPWIISLTPDSQFWDQFASEEVWYDRTHLNSEGAKKVSLIIANDITAVIGSVDQD